MLAQANTRTASAEYNAAAARLELAQIRERLAKLKSQAEPLNSIGNREQCYQAAFYAVVGRMP
jgi:hypothetical protein